MRKAISFIVSSSLAFQFVPFAAFAAFHEGVQERRAETREAIGQKRDALKQEVRERRDTLKQEFKERSSALKEEFENGRDVVDVRSKLLTAREKIADAERALGDAKAKYNEATKNPDFKAAFKKVREVVAGVKEKVKAAHRALVEVVTSLKGLGGGEKPQETPAAPAPASTPSQ